MPDESFLRLQSEMFTCLSSMFSDPEAAVDILCWHGKFDLAAEVAKINRDDYSESIEVRSFTISSIHGLDRMVDQSYA